MKLLDDLIASLTADSLVREVYAGALWTAVISRNCGLASTFRDERPHHDKVRDAGSLRGKPALELARYARSDNLLEASIGMAAINSLIDADKNSCVKGNALDILIEKGRGKKIAIVGHFPWVPQLQKIAKELWVIEQRPQEGDLPEEAASEILPQADVIGITGTSFINHTIEKLLDFSKGRFTILIGPTSPLSPVLFGYGVDVISGVRVTDAERAIRCISEGAIFKEMHGVELVSMTREKQ